ncbi:MAG: YfhO family protein [Vicinamibacteria bacterium]|nr:YfhO family protein [Vicinamibacteria bacterium]
MSRRAAAAYGAAAVVPALWALEGVLRGGALFERDVHLSWHAHAWAFKGAVAAGELPLWDPAWGFGQPHWANPQTQSAYPTTWLLLGLEPWAAYSVLVLVHVAWAAIGAFALGRRLGLAAPAAALSGALFAASGPMLSMANLWHQLSGAAWLPWVALAALRALAAPGPGAAALWGASLALQVLAGSGEMALCGGLLSALLAGGTLVNGDRRRSRFATAAAAAVLAIASSAVSWWPALELAARSEREALTAAARTYWSVRPGALAQLFLPAPVDTLPRPADDPLVAREDSEPFFLSLYLGLPALGLLVAASASERRRAVLVLAALSLAAVAFALGRHAPFHALAEWLLPPLQGLRFPVKAMAPAALGLALLAALGAEACARGDEVGRRARLRALAALALGVGLAAALAFVPLAAAPFVRPFPAPRPPFVAAGLTAAAALGLALLARAGRPAWGAAVISCAAAAELGSAHHGLNALAPADLLRFRPPTVDALPANARIHVWDYRTRPAGKRFPERDFRAFFHEVPVGLPPAFARALGLQHYLFPSIAPRHGLAGSFSHDLMRLYPLPLRDLVQLQRDSAETPGYLRLLQLGSVDAVLALHGEGHPGLRETAVLPGGFAEPIHVFAVPDPLPRVRAVAGVRRADGWHAYRVLLDAGFDPARELVLADAAPRPAPADFTAVVQESKRGHARLELSAELSHDGFVVLSEAWDPGWRAEVDGKPAPVLRANVAFRAVPVPAGRHHVRLEYRPGAWAAATALTLFGLLALAGLAVAGGLGAEERPFAT